MIFSCFASALCGRKPRTSPRESTAQDLVTSAPSATEDRQSMDQNETNYTDASPPRVDVGIDIWEEVIWHLKRPLPSLGAPVGRQGWHQKDLASCMRVCKLFNILASRQLYTDPVVSDTWSFALGADSEDHAQSTAGGGRRSKLECLAGVERVFIELPHWQSTIPNDDWVDECTSVEREAAHARYMARRHPTLHPRFVVSQPSWGAWAARVKDGCAALVGAQAFRPSRMVFEAFYVVDGSQIERERDEHLAPILGSYATLVARVDPAQICCWTGQALQSIAAAAKQTAQTDTPLRSAITKHVGVEDGLETPLRDLKIRFRSPWLGTNGAARGTTDNALVYEFKAFLADYTALLESEHEANPLPKVNAPPAFKVDIYPFFPSRIAPHASAWMSNGGHPRRAGDSTHNREANSTGTTPLAGVVTSASPVSASSNTNTPFELYRDYAHHWELWCSYISAVQDCRLIDARVTDSPTCEACGDSPPDPYAPESGLVYDHRMACEAFDEVDRLGL